MLLQKRVLRPDRLRRVPAQFSWVDQRLVRDRHIERCSLEGLALYLLLNIVGDAQGISYYADVTVCRCLSIEQEQLVRARAQLIALSLIAYQCPFYQVLSLDPPPAPRVCGVRPARATLAAFHTHRAPRKAP
jgi:hypothetical protein